MRRLAVLEHKHKWGVDVYVAWTDIEVRDDDVSGQAEWVAKQLGADYDPKEPGGEELDLRFIDAWDIPVILGSS